MALDSLGLVEVLRRAARGFAKKTLRVLGQRLGFGKASGFTASE